MFKGVNTWYIKRVWMIFNCWWLFFASSTFLHCSQEKKKSHQSIKTRQLATNSERVLSRSATSETGNLSLFNDRRTVPGRSYPGSNQLNVIPLPTVMFRTVKTNSRNSWT